ncbi:chromate transporter [Methylobacterium sp. NEAU 140]|uniref:chromate transporter n=1 Tax=Methylobacterium sp. NEAU 140 TaxID=3064945 RepID=UPI00273550A7|nr:chromate transporter [Methylobacterium sp. NEAU 140]MDP4021665.1 chromate transporter [Methylobacterium sp. NEAU 140]
MKVSDLLALATFFSTLSILSIGGSNSVVPEMARHAVGEAHWLTSDAFSDIFAISQAAPGPSNLIVAMIGYKVAGITGAVVAQAAMMLPAGLLMIVVSRIWQSTSGSAWHVALERALGPIAVGLILASGWTVAEGAGFSIRGYVAAALCTLLFWRTKFSPLPVLAAAGVLGWAGII